MPRWARAIEQYMAMDDDVWRRHENPWSGWTRVPILPAFAACLWSRDRLGWWFLIPTAIVFLWIWVNPRVFPPPTDRTAWMTRGVIGERLWLSGVRPAGDGPRVVRRLTATASSAAVVMLVGLALKNLTLTVSGVAVATLAKLWFIDRMVMLADGSPPPVGGDDVDGVDGGVETASKRPRNVG